MTEVPSQSHSHSNMSCQIGLSAEIGSCSCPSLFLFLSWFMS